MSLAHFARTINQDNEKQSQMAIGKVRKHPDGRTVKIKSGQFLDSTYGRVSNWWTWNEVLEDNKLGPDESGYGW